MDYPRKTGHLPTYMYLQLLGRTGADEHDLASGMDIPDKPRCIDHQRIELQESLPPRAVCFVKRKGHPLSVAARELEKMIVEFGKEG